MSIQFTLTINDSEIINGIEYTKDQLLQGLAQIRSEYNERTSSSLTDAEWLNNICLLQNLAAWYEQGKRKEAVPPSPITLTVNWQELITSLEPYFTIGLQGNYIVFTQCFNMLIALKRTATFNSNIEEWRNFAFNLNLGKDQFNNEQKTEIEAIFASVGVPFTFD